MAMYVTEFEATPYYSKQHLSKAILERLDRPSK